ncbi:MAG: chromosome segregation protein SMC [Rhodobacteraceae bacterium]|nr:chromosome segregation protein SMC [Paracoccaceae bacterium]
MQFNRLRLTGFKSFVDPTDLVIARGLTGVVGPNGCGKSNLLEALRWVMGENRPTAMRGDGMEDVIFAGATSRPARNFAEVALHLDNSDRTAPAGFNDQDQLEIIRRITRDAGSAYKTNGKDVRARDVQMLFADASTGAHSPALVRQGQISELINAKPKSRRRILEEAAGISGLYQRRHEAELKLNGAEQNLLRVDDVLEQLQAQLATLARQARQAARYREISEELRRSEGLLLYRRWREADQKLVESEAELKRLTSLAATVQTAATAAMRHRGECDDAVPPLREEEAIAAAILQRLLVERDSLKDQEARAEATIVTLKSQIEQLATDIGREAGLNRDAHETIERLDWEKAALEKASVGFEDKLDQASQQARDAGVTLQDAETRLGQMTEDMARLSARHLSAQRLFSDSKTMLERNEAETARASGQVEAAMAEKASAEALHAAAMAERDRAATATEAAEAALEKAEAERSEKQATEAEARGERSEAEGEANAIRAEVNALGRMVERERAEGGQILDQMKVARGYEAALGAALADDLRAPELFEDGGSGWALLPDYATAQPLPAGAARLADHVTAPGVLARRISQVGIVDRAEGAGLQAKLLPGQRLVSLKGDLWRWDGFRAGAEDAPSAAALKLQQINRLEELTEALASADARAEAAATLHRELAAELMVLAEADKACRQTRRQADEALTAAARALSRLEAERSLCDGRLDAARLAVKRHEEETLANRRQLREAEAAVRDLDNLDTARAAVETVKVSVEAARMTMMSRRSMADELRREGEARHRRLQEIDKEAANWRQRLETADNRQEELQARKSASEAELLAASAGPGEIAARREKLNGSIQEAEARRARAGDALAEGEAALRNAITAEREAERQAGEAREGRARADAMRDAARQQAAAAVDRIDEELGIAPSALLEMLGGDPEQMPTSERIEIEVLRLRRQRDALGAVNLRAEEDAREVQAEHDALRLEKNDLEAAISKLRSGIASLNREGRERLLTAFDEVNKSFELLFRHLFGGGEAKLVLVESDDPLEAGLEIMCQPPGKKLSTLSLLSGGEQTLTALALIFAVFLANPAPICVLDEVDAPLDDANVTRFCDLLDEMTRQTDTRFLIITHHAVTMARMDRLFGVTMAEPGVSQLVSVDLSRAEKMVA